MESGSAEVKNGGDRERGLSYISDRLEKKGLVTSDDVIVFMSDLGLPPMGKEELVLKFAAVGASSEGFTKLPHFFHFVLSQLKTHTEVKRLEAFKVSIFCIRFHSLTYVVYSMHLQINSMF